MEENNHQKSIGRAAVKYTGPGLLVGGILGSLIGSLFEKEIVWGGLVGAALGLILGAVLDTYARAETDQEYPIQPILGIQLLAYLYCLGSAVLLLALPFNHQKVGAQMAALHGLPALSSIPILILISAVGLLIGIGLYKMTPWGYWLSLVYLVYLFVVPQLLVGDIPSVFGNIVWPLSTGVYLILKREAYFLASGIRK